ncbi:MAG: T9SS type A sorting domain-containing protein [Bacteroidetes bacterium]|nr:T9SS type A sorting domain-containing protein [Bacteroidota bacterium]
MKKLFLILGILLAAGIVVSVQAQNTQVDKTNPAEYPIWIEMMQDQNANFYETVDAFNVYWENRPDRKGSGYNPFKRWEWYMKHKINPDGSRRPVGLDAQLYDNFVNNQKNTDVFEGDWNNIGPIQLPSSPYSFWGNGRINAIAFHPTDADIIYIGAPAGGLWRSDDGGQNWITLTDNQPTLGISSIVVDYSNPDIIYIGTGDRDAGDAEGMGVHKSTDGGITFYPIIDEMGYSTVGRLIIHPSNPQLIYAATSSGIFKSIDGGNQWNRTQTGNIKEIVFNPNNPDIIYASGTGNFYKSINAGDSFTKITNGITTSASRGVIDVSVANPNYVYFFTTSSSAYIGTYLSVDNGDSFTLQSDSPNVMGWACNGGAGGQAWYDLDIAVDPTNENVIYAGGINCWKSIDAGQNWTMVSNQTGECGAYPVHADLHVLEWNPLNNNLYVGNDGGIWFTDNDGTTWNRITNGLAIGQQYKLGQSKLLQNHVTTGYQDNGISLFHTDTWIQSDMYADGMEAEMDNHDTLLSYGCMQYGRMYRMVNDKADNLIAGQGIGGINEQGNWITPFCQHETNPEVMFAGYQNLWRTTNLQQGSPTWVKISSNVGSGSVTVVEHSPADGNLFYYVTSGNSFVKSENIMDPNPSYSNLQSMLPGSGTITDVEAHPWNADIVYITRGTGIYKSVNKGVSWEEITGGLPNMSLNDVAFYNRNNIEGLYVATNIGVFFKDEFMADWFMFSENLPAAILVTEIEIYHDFLDPTMDRVRASSYGRGLWGSPTYYYSPTANFEASETNIPAGCAIDFFDLSQGYPHSWLWTFEGGIPSTSMESNPTGVIFENEGSYEVSLTVTNPDGSDTKIVAGYITVVQGLLPTVAFIANQTSQCSNASIYLYDESEGCPTGWEWSFSPNNVTYLEGTSETSQNPVVQFGEIGSYSVTLTVSNSSGQSQLAKDDYLFIGGELLPFTEDFSGASFDAMGWEIENPDQSITWGLTDAETPLGIIEGVSWINNFNYSNMGARDYMISPIMNFSGFSNIYMTFEYAYAERYSPSDSLIVGVSNDCGNTWTNVYANGPNGEGVFATAEPTTDSFEPQSSSDWCVAGYGPSCPIIDLSSWAGNANIKIRFESYSRYGNNLYINKVDISNTVGLFENKSVTDDGFLIHPNPATQQVSILVKEKGNHQIELLDTHGRVIISDVIVGDKMVLDISNLTQGIYFVRVKSENHSDIKKLIVQ